MTRSKSFDVDVARRKISQLFRRQGYAATSMKHIEAETGLLPGSLYNAFGSKEKLFRSALEYYIDDVVDRRIEKYLQGDDPMPALRALFASTYSVELGEHRGCLLTNTATEGTVHDDASRRAALAGMRRLEAAFGELLERGRCAGRIGRSKNTAVLARQLALSYQGILVMCKVVRSRDVLDEYTEAALCGLD